jgi:hypothetical protein
METFAAAGLNNEAIQLERAGNFVDAEAKHLEALCLKIRGSGEHSVPAAVTRNGLGELYIKMGKLDEAQEQLEQADHVREGKYHMRENISPGTDCEIGLDNFDTACTRDNLGRVFEMKDDFEKVVEWRTKGGSNKMICSHFDVSSPRFFVYWHRHSLISIKQCPRSNNCQFSKRADLNVCARCKSAWYCGKDCQRKDWKERHKVYCKAPEAAPTAA